MNQKFIFAFFWFCAIAIPAVGQYQVDLNVLTVDEGLSQNLVTILHTDSRGFLWIGTNDGLNRFDGYENRIFRRSISDSTTISSNNIYELAETSDNRIVVGHNNGHISIWNPKESRFRRYTNHISSIPATTNNVIFNLTVSENDDIYALLDSGILRFNSISDQFDFISLPVEIPNLRGIFAEADSTLLIFSFQHTIHRYHLESGNFETLPRYTEQPIGSAQEFTYLGDNRYAIARLGFVYIYDAISQQTISKVELPYLISSMTYDGSRLWVAGEGIQMHYWLPETPAYAPVWYHLLCGEWESCLKCVTLR